MKTLNIPLEDKEFNLLEKEKGEMNWHDFIMQLAKDDTIVELIEKGVRKNEQ